MGCTVYRLAADPGTPLSRIGDMSLSVSTDGVETLSPHCLSTQSSLDTQLPPENAADLHAIFAGQRRDDPDDY